MSHKTKEDAARYAREWRARNREHVREYDRGRYPDRKETLDEYKRNTYLANRDARLAKQKSYYEEHKEEHSVRMRLYRECNVARKIVNEARRRSDKYGVPFDLTVEYVESIIPERCPVFGVALKVGKGRPEPGSPSLDRIVPAVGYVQGNVQVISNKANMMKQNATPDELRQFAAWVLANAPTQFANDY